MDAIAKGDDEQKHFQNPGQRQECIHYAHDDVVAPAAG